MRVQVNENPPSLRRDDEQLRRQLDPNAPADAGRGGRGTPAAGGGRGRGAEPPDPTRVSPQVVNNAVNALMLSAGVAVRVNGRSAANGTC